MAGIELSQLEDRDREIQEGQINSKTYENRGVIRKGKEEQQIQRPQRNRRMLRKICATCRDHLRLKGCHTA